MNSGLVDKNTSSQDARTTDKALNRLQRMWSSLSLGKKRDQPTAQQRVNGQLLDPRWVRGGDAHGRSQATAYGAAKQFPNPTSRGTAAGISSSALQRPMTTAAASKGPDGHRQADCTNDPRRKAPDPYQAGTARGTANQATKNSIPVPKNSPTIDTRSDRSNRPGQEGGPALPGEVGTNANSHLKQQKLSGLPPKPGPSWTVNTPVQGRAMARDRPVPASSVPLCSKAEGGTRQQSMHTMPISKPTTNQHNITADSSRTPLQVRPGQPTDNTLRCGAPPSLVPEYQNNETHPPGLRPPTSDARAPTPIPYGTSSAGVARPASSQSRALASTARPSIVEPQASRTNLRPNAARPPMASNQLPKLPAATKTAPPQAQPNSTIKSYYHPKKAAKQAKTPARSQVSRPTNALSAQPNLPRKPPTSRQKLQDPLVSGTDFAPNNVVAPVLVLRPQMSLASPNSNPVRREIAPTKDVNWSTPPATLNGSLRNAKPISSTKKPNNAPKAASAPKKARNLNNLRQTAVPERPSIAKNGNIPARKTLDSTMAKVATPQPTALLPDKRSNASPTRSPSNVPNNRQNQKRIPAQTHQNKAGPPETRKEQIQLRRQTLQRPHQEITGNVADRKDDSVKHTSAPKITRPETAVKDGGLGAA